MPGEPLGVLGVLGVWKRPGSGSGRDRQRTLTQTARALSQTSQTTNCQTTTSKKSHRGKKSGKFYKICRKLRESWRVCEPHYDKQEWTWMSGLK